MKDLSLPRSAQGSRWVVVAMSLIIVSNMIPLLGSGTESDTIRFGFALAALLLINVSHYRATAAPAGGAPAPAEGLA